MSSECHWWWVELFFQIKKKKSNFIFNMFRKSYSSVNIFSSVFTPKLYRNLLFPEDPEN